MKPDEVKKLRLGLYRIEWSDGGWSLAAVGNNEKEKWFHPVNWISGPSTDWAMVKRVELIEDRAEQ